MEERVYKSGPCIEGKHDECPSPHRCTCHCHGGRDRAEPRKPQPRRGASKKLEEVNA